MWKSITSILVPIVLVIHCASCVQEQSGVANTHQEQMSMQAVRRVVSEALKSVAFKEGAKVRVFDKEIESGFVVIADNGGVAGTDPILQPVVIKAAGYLVFIDEQPGYDWAHQCKIVFIPRAASTNAILLFDEQIFPDIIVKDVAQSNVAGKWYSL